jgi:tripartite-type tricarboxylate transporter receptor subunit TctC
MNILSACALRKIFLIVLMPLGLVHAQQNYPSKPVRVVVPVAPGGGIDIVGRFVGAKLNDDLKQQFVADNRSGAAGIIGTEIVAKAPADGYTLLMQNSALSYMPSLYSKLPYDVLRDFSPVSLIAATPSVLVVHPSVAAMNVKELIALMKARPGQLNYGAFVGGTLHLAVALFEDMAGVKATLIPYKGGGPALVDAVGGQIQMLIVPQVSAMGHLKANRLRALGTSGVKRAALLPDVPTIAESGVPDYHYTTWYGLLAPAATSQAVVTKLHLSVSKALASADLRDKFAPLGLEIESGGPVPFALMLKQEVARWSRIIKAAKIQAE